MLSGVSRLIRRLDRSTRVLGGSLPYQPLFEKLTISVVIALLAVGSFYFLTSSIQAILYPYGMDYGEGPLLNQAQLLAMGRNIYRPDKENGIRAG